MIKRKGRMRKLLIVCLLQILTMVAYGQQMLTLEQCRALALANNKQLTATKLSEDIAYNARQAAKTKYLPRVNGVAGYELFSREISILNNNQKSALSNLGTNAMGKIGSSVSDVVTGMVQKGIITPQTAQELSGMFQQISTPLAQKGNEIGNSIRDAFRTDTRNMFAASIVVTQPLYMGGGITAANEMARINQELAKNVVENTRQSTLFAIDNAYWLAVSLKNKEKLAKDFLGLVKKLDDDVHKLIREGVATRADGLKVDVAVNNAEMTVTQVEDGVSLAKMYLCQLCGLPLDGSITLADEQNIGNSITLTAEELAAPTSSASEDSLHSNRPEVRLLENAVDLSEQATKLTRALYRPHVMLTGGLLVTNPNVYNGFERKFKDLWSVGVMVQVPIWNWREGRYKINASKTATAIARMELADLREKISLQVEQSRFKVKEAQKKVAMTTKNMASAEENLRCANVGFREGVMTITEVMEAQTAWQKAQTQKIDAEIEAKLSQIELQKALGKL